jgi:hypothetical protein
VRRRVSLIFAFVFIAALFTQYGANAATSTYHFSTKGPGADGDWSSCSGTGVVSCTETYINAADQITKDNGSTVTGGAIFIDIFSYHCTRHACYFDSDRSGVGSATVSVSTKLTSASASGTLSMVLCDQNFNCVDDGTSDIAASWTGYGGLTKQSGSFRYKDSTSSYSERFSGTFRNADGTATVDGANAGDLNFAEIFTTTDRQVSICHNC